MKFVYSALASVALIVGTTQTSFAHGGNDYLGSVFLVGGSGGGFCPRGSIPAYGTLLPISEHQALYAIYGTEFGGNGSTHFAIPDLSDAPMTKNGSEMLYCVVTNGVFPIRP